MKPDTSEAEHLAAKIVDSLGAAEALVTAMRIVLLVGQRMPEDDNVVDAAREAISALKRVGVATGDLTTS